MSPSLEFLRHLRHDPVRRRGHEVSRLEAFSDAVFGFAVTLLVISQRVPHDYKSLMHLISRLPAFVATFLALFHLWHEHYRFFRRYGLEDGTTMVLNLVVLITVVAYLYPLKFLFDAFFSVFVPGAPAVHVDLAQMSHLMAVYDVGCAAVYLGFAGLYLNARRQAARLELTAEEALHTSHLARQYALVVGCAVVSLGVIAVVPPRSGAAMWGGLCYFLLWPATMANAWVTHRARMRLAPDPGPAAGTAPQ